MNADNYLEPIEGDEPAHIENTAPTVTENDVTEGGERTLQKANEVLDLIAVSDAPSKVQRAALTGMQAISSILDHARRAKIKQRRAALAPARSKE